MPSRVHEGNVRRSNYDKHLTNNQSVVHIRRVVKVEMKEGYGWVFFVCYEVKELMLFCPKE